MANDSQPRADDLLAQLAGEDLDRMLAEAEVETAAAPATHSPEKSSPANASAISSEGLAENLDTLFQEMAQENAEADSPIHPASKSEPVNGDTNALDDQVLAASAERSAGLNVSFQSQAHAHESHDVDAEGIDSAKLEESLNALINDMEDPSSTTETAPPAAVESKAIPETQKQAPGLENGSGQSPGQAPRPAAVSETAARDSQTKAGPPASAESAPAASATQPADEKPAASEADVPLPLWLRPLEWINAPLDFLPDEVREAIAKIALVTLINAVVVIGYVLLFRRK